MKHLTVAALLTAMCGSAAADLRVTFLESAPKDRFTLTNTGPCPLSDLSVEIDLGASAAGLIFDVTEQGAGVSVFQPLELVTGRAFLVNLPDVRDGDTSITLSISTLAPDAEIAFTIDVDDTTGLRATTISGAEIEGAVVNVDQQGRQIAARFGSDAMATVPISGCQA